MFTFEQPIRFSHCDPAAILYFPHVFNFVNTAVEDWFERSLGMSFHAMHLQHGLGNPIVRTQCEFFRACRFGETLQLGLSVQHVGRSSMQMLLSGCVEGEERFRARHRTSMMSMQTLRAVAIPDALRERALAFVVPSGDMTLTHLPKAPIPSKAFLSRQLVRYEHCDPGERVYFARFFDMFNAALEDWFADGLGCPWGSELMVPPRNLRTPSLSIDVEFLHACLLGERLEFHLWPTRLGRSSFDLELAATGHGQERLRARWTLCMTSHHTHRAVPIPDDLRSRMQGFLINPEES